MNWTTYLACILLAVTPGLAGEPETLTLPSKSPLVTFRILFRTGAASDPAGKEGVAALTAAMLSGGGSQQMPYEKIIEELFPMASSVQAQVDKEMTVFQGVTHVENLDRYYGILRAMLLEPGWREEDFRRVKDEALNFLTIQLRSNNEEELGKEYLYLKIYEKHPYGHHNAGTVSSLNKLTLADVKAFYAANYLRGNAILGLAGGYPEGFDKKVAADFSKLPDGKTEAVKLPEPARAKKLRIHIIEKDTRSTLISLGFPLGVIRGQPDWPALKLTESYFGQHRSGKSHLFQRIREIRGMNYGDYAYIEYFPRGMFQFRPDPNQARRQQIFQIWIRPVEPQNGLFALKIALYELNKLVEEGLSAENFTSTREFLSKFVNLLLQTESDALGYGIDSDVYGIPAFNDYLKSALNDLAAEKVNEAIRKHLRSTDLDVVIITKDAAGLKKAILSGERATIQYASPPPEEILEEDKAIVEYRLDAGSVEIIPVGSIFEK